MVARPRIFLDAPSIVRAGEDVEVIVHVDCKTVCRARAVEVALVGRFDSPTRSHRLHFERRRATVDDELLPAGVGLYRFRLPVPENLALSVRSPGLEIAYEVRASVDLPLRLDPHQAVAIDIEPGRRQLPEGLTCGASVRIPIHPPVDQDAGEVRVDLVGSLTRHGSVVETMRFTIGRAVPWHPRPVAGIDVTVPREVLPSLATAELAVDWQVQLYVGERWVETRPVFVRAAARVATGTPPPAFVPDAAKLRLDTWWMRAANGIGLHASMPSGRFVGAFHGTAIEAWIEDDDFHAALAYPPLELDLEASGRGRHANQVAAVLAALAPALEPFSVDYLDDRRAQVVYGTAARTSVDAFLERLLRLADRLGESRPAVPPPPPMADGLLAWSRLATWLEGTLSTARMRIVGRHADARIEVTTLWHGTRPFRTRVALLPARYLELSPVRLSWIEAGRPPVDARGQPLPTERRTLLERIAVGAYALEVDAERVVLDLPAPLNDGEFIRERIEQMAQLVEVLRGLAAPFR